MRRLRILLRVEFKAWLRDPVTALRGFAPAVILLITFGFLFGGRHALKVAVLDDDAGPNGRLLTQAVRDTHSPFGTAYYEVVELPGELAWQAFYAQRIDGVWVIPADFSERLAHGERPTVEMHFGDHGDDWAKKHRIYAAETLWSFYQRTGQQPPPLALAEEYSLPQMTAWFPAIALGVVLLSTALGGMLYVFVLKHREQMTRVTPEFGLAPRSLAWVFLPRLLLGLAMGLLTGTIFLAILYLWIGVWPGHHLAAIYLLAGLVALFWISVSLLVSLRVRHCTAGAIGSLLTAVTLFFTGGGLSIVRGYEDRVLWTARLFPTTHAVDPLGDLALYTSWLSPWTAMVVRLAAFAAAALTIGVAVAARRLRRPG